MKQFVGAVARSLLAFATGITLLDCAGVIGYLSPITLPVLTGLLWIAARRAGPWDLGLWLFLAGASGWRIGQMIDCAYLSTCGELPFMPILVSFSAVFFFTATLDRRPPRREPF